MNMTVTLLVVTLVASTALGFVYEWTKDPIAAAKLAKQKKAIDMVVGEYDNDPLSDQFKRLLPSSFDSLELYPAYKSGEMSGMAVKTFSSKGYSGNIWLMVGFLPDGAIKSIFVLEHKETPGLGSKMSDPKFLDQFINRSPEDFQLKVKKDGGDIDAITGATITSRAFGDAVEKAYKVFKEGKDDE